jgi:hypothetical protein
VPFEPGVALDVLRYVLLVALPGGAIVRLARVRSGDRLVHLGLAIGAGLALQPLLYLWADVAGLTLGRLAWWCVLGASLGVLLAAAPRDVRSFDPRRALGRVRPPTLAMAVLVTLVLLARWWAAHTLSVPLWGDSLHHSMIVQLFALRGALPADWQPLAPLATFTYHFGLHAGVASLVTLSDLPAHRALLIAGQTLMVFQVLTAYALAAGLTGQRWAGVGAALAAAGLSPMPAYYLNWGRYTQLAGQVVLPAAALATAWLLTPRRVRSRAVGMGPGRRPAGGATPARAVALASVLVAGLVLTHYIVTVFYALFIVAWVIAGVRRRKGRRPVPEAQSGPARVRRIAARGGASALGAALLVAPWLLRLRDSLLARAAAALVTRALPDPNVYGVVAPSFVWGEMALHVGWPLVAAALLASIWGLVRRVRLVAAGLLWTALLVVAAYPRTLGLPVTGPLKDFTVAIGLYVPLGLVVGAGLGDALRWCARRVRWSDRAALCGTVALGVALAWTGRDVVVARHVLVTGADERAMAWIRQHTPGDAVFLVGCLPAYGDTVCAGDDAGWWLPLLADRPGTVPPITYALETTIDPGYRDQVNRLAALWRADLDGAATRAALAAAGVRYAYAGATGHALDRARLAASPHWQRVYDRDGVQIYAGPDAPVGR